MIYPLLTTGLIWLLVGINGSGLDRWWPAPTGLIERVFPTVVLFTAGYLYWLSFKSNHRSPRLYRLGAFISLLLWPAALAAVTTPENAGVGIGAIITVAFAVVVISRSDIGTVAGVMVFALIQALTSLLFLVDINEPDMLFIIAWPLFYIIAILWLFVTYCISIFASGFIRNVVNNSAKKCPKDPPGEYAIIWLCLLFLTYLLTYLSAGFSRWLPEVSGGIIVFLVILPLCNAFFDWLSIGIAQRVLQRAVADDAQTPWAAENWWIYLMLFTPLVPAIAHGVIAVASVIAWPGDKRLKQMAGWLEHRAATGSFSPNADVDALARYLSWGQYIPWVALGTLGVLAGLLLTFLIASLPWLVLSVLSLLR